jgi:hypothetical protein
MKWSRLKSLVEERFAPSVARRVALHQARYRHANEEVGRITLTVDRKEAAAFATHMGWRRVRPLADELMHAREAWGSPAAYARAEAEVRDRLRAEGEFSDAAAIEDLEAFLSMSIEDALASPSPLVRALAMLDGRLGKRRLRAFHFTENEHVLVRALHSVRCEAEGVSIDAPAV